MSFSPKFRYHRHNMPLMQQYLTHLQSFLPSWRSLRIVDSHLASRPSAPIFSTSTEFSRAVTHSFFLTPLIEKRDLDNSESEAVPAQKKRQGERALWSIVKVRNPSPPRRRGSCAGDPLPSDPVPSLFVLLCEPVDIVRSFALAWLFLISEGNAKKSQRKRRQTESCAPLSSPVSHSGSSHTPTFLIHHYHWTVITFIIGAVAVGRLLPESSSFSSLTQPRTLAAQSCTYPHNNYCLFLVKSSRVKGLPISVGRTPLPRNSCQLHRKPCAKPRPTQPNPSLSIDRRLPCIFIYFC